MAQNITLLGASYSAVPAVTLPKTGGGTARFDDASVTTATASDVASGKVFLASDGTITTGTASGGGGSYTRTVICPQQTFTGDSQRRATLTGMTAGLIDGDYYIVTYDGTEWLTTCETLWSTNRSIGEVQWFLTTLDSVYPFGVIWESGNTANVAAANTSQHTIKIERLEFIDEPSPTPVLQNKTVNVTPTESAQSQTATADSGYDGLGEVEVNVSAVSSTYVGSGVSRQAAQTIHPSTSDQTIASGKYLTGAQTVKAVTLTNLTAANIKSGVVVQVGDSTDSDCVASVTGTYSGGGTSKNIQVNQTGGSVRTNVYTSTGVSITVAKAGTYNVSWTAWRSSSQGTMGTNLYKNNTAGTNQQTWTSTYGQHITLANQTYAQGDVLTLYATAGSNSRYCYVGDLVIVEQ